MSANQLSKSLIRTRVFVSQIAKSVVAEWVAWDRKWREQALRAAEMDRIRVREQERIYERLPITKWSGLS